MTKYFIIIGLSLLLNSCYYDAENLLYSGGNNCDSIKGLYSTEVKPLIDKKCISCHNTSNQSGNINLDNYNGVKNNSGKIFGSISHSSGNSPMPKGEPKMSDCEIKKVQLWISNGSLNN